jgi:hypothetical protein
MAVTDGQVRKLMAELEKHGEIGTAALRAGMDRKTARKYRDAGQLPSELKEARDWRTRDDPFAADWPYLLERLEAAPELEAWALFEHLGELHPGRYSEGQLRTLQRRLKRWRAQEGPPKEVFFAQEHRPGEAAQTDFTSANELGVTIGGELFEHMLCHVVLPYSNWQWATVCRSESILSLRRGLQAALFRLEHVPEFHQTDNSTAATHASRNEEGRFVSWDEEGKRPSGRRFNERYLEIMKHFGMKPRTTGIGAKEQNGDVESLNGAVKRRLKQHLLLRGSTDFEDVPAYESWVWGVLEKANRLRTKRLQDELRVMRPLAVERLPEFSIERTRVTLWSTVRILSNTYSVPSRLQGERVEVRVHEDHLEIFHDGTLQLRAERLLGINHSRIEYRHVVDSLVKKPGAFARYRFRESFFPSLVFRRAHDALHEVLSVWQGDLEYLRILQLAARTLEADVEAALSVLLEERETPRFSKVEALVLPARPQIHDQAPPVVDLKGYDALIEEAVT